MRHKYSQMQYIVLRARDMAELSVVGTEVCAMKICRLSEYEFRRVRASRVEGP